MFFFYVAHLLCVFFRYARLHVEPKKRGGGGGEKKHNQRNKQSPQIVKLSAAFKARDYVQVNVGLDAES